MRRPDRDRDITNSELAECLSDHERKDRRRFKRVNRRIRKVERRITRRIDNMLFKVVSAQALIALMLGIALRFGG